MAKDFNTLRFLNESEECAVIEITGTIGGFDWDEWKEINTIQIMQKELRRLKELNTKNIEVRINSLGGYVDHALAIHDALKDHPSHITTIVNSFCASAATIIAMAGDERKISKNALYLIHKCSNRVNGNEHDLEMELESQKKTNGVFYNIYKEHCKKDESELQDLFNYDNGNGKWLTAQEVLDFGFATDIYNDEKQSGKAAVIDSKMLNLLNLPQLPRELVEDKNIANSEEIANSVFVKIKEFLKPKKTDPIINQNKTDMKKFSNFVFLSTMFAALASIDYDPKEGQTFTDEQVNEIEKQLKELAELKDNFAALEADKKASDEKMKALEASVETITKERDDYKAKYEKAPAIKQDVAGNDPKDSFETYVENDDYYKSIEQTINQF